MRATWLVGAMAAMLGVGLTGACGGNVGSFTTSSSSSSSSTGAPYVCVPGTQTFCPCPGGAPGAQRCSDDGTALGPCLGCDGTGGAGGTSTSSASTGGTAGSGGESTVTTGSATGGAGGGACFVNSDCGVSWLLDIYGGIIEPGSSGCTSSLCHGAGQGNITIAQGDPAGAYAIFKNLVLAPIPGPAKRYVVPCDKEASGILCNTKVPSDATNPYGNCGSLMPQVGSLPVDQLAKIAEWIDCGAPEN